MAIDYKRMAVNAYLTELYCAEDKYQNKYKELIERALFSD